MQIFVTGATGVLGRAVTARLLARGDDVAALSRSVENDGRIRHLGARPVAADMLSGEGLEAALEGREAILHLATHMPGSRTNNWQYCLHFR